VFDADQTLVGYLAASLTTEPLDEIMSGDGSWDGFGESGDAYIVGPDAVMRTTTRSFTEAPREYTAAPSEPGAFDLTDAQRRRIAATGTTALVQPVSRQQIAATDSTSGVERVKNYRGVDVVAAYRPVDIEGLDWRVVVEVDAEELDGPITDYARSMIFAVAFFVVGVTFIAVRWADRLLAPIRAISARLRAVRADGIDAVGDTDAVLPDDSPQEYLELSANIDEMLDRLRERSAEVASRSEERSRLVAEFLPAAAAQRRQAGDDVVDHVRAASVAVLILDGVGFVVEGMEEGEQRRLLAEIVDQIDELAADFGLERVKITGTTYFAVCGVSRPYLDHAPRCVRFALAAAELVEDLSRERRADLALSAGVESGAIAVGLSGRAGLVYDAWGAAVHDAAELARRSPKGTVSVSAEVRRQLPNEFVLADSGSGDDATIVTTRVSEASS
jgi:class 3 adenylate cyclase